MYYIQMKIRNYTKNKEKTFVIARLFNTLGNKGENFCRFDNWATKTYQKGHISARESEKMALSTTRAENYRTIIDIGHLT